MGYSKIISTVPSDIQIRSTAMREVVPIKSIRSLYLRNNNITAGWLLDVKLYYPDKKYKDILVKMLDYIDSITISFFEDNYTKPIMTYSNLMYFTAINNDEISFVMENRTPR